MSSDGDQNGLENLTRAAPRRFNIAEGDDGQLRAEETGGGGLTPEQQRLRTAPARVDPSIVDFLNKYSEDMSAASAAATRPPRMAGIRKPRNTLSHARREGMDAASTAQTAVYPSSTSSTFTGLSFVNLPL